MQTKKSKLVQVSAAALAFTALFTASAFAAHKKHHHVAHYHALTVRQQAYAAPAPDPYHGPGAPFTAPVAIGSTVVGLPFQAASQVFPYNNTSSPLILIGAPLHVIGGIVQMPFYVVNSAFGMSPASPF